MRFSLNGRNFPAGRQFVLGIGDDVGKRRWLAAQLGQALLDGLSHVWAAGE